MKKLLPLFILLFSFPILGQIVSLQSPKTKCEESLRSAKLRGFQLGMTAAEVRKAYPEIKIPKADSFGKSDTGIYLIRNKYTIPKNPRIKYLNSTKYSDLTGSSALALEFIDLKLSRIFIKYDPDWWEDLEDFTEALSQKIGLPDDWEFVEIDGREMARMVCNKHSIATSLGEINEWYRYSPFLEIRDLTSAEIYQKRSDDFDAEIEKLEQDGKETRKRAFKP